MSGVFLSYSRADRALAYQVVTNLRALGVDVWWDEDLPGVNWQRELARQIDKLAAVLVLWTPTSFASDNVADEARLGKHLKKLVNAKCGVSSPPFPFEGINALPLDGWTGRESHRGWTLLVQTLEDQLVEAGAAKPSELTGALARRERAIRQKESEVTAAQEAFQTAQAEETAAARAVAAAAKDLEAKEGQLRRVVQMEVSLALVRAAQGELDAALSAREAADAAHRAAEAALAGASRVLTRAKAAVERLFDEPAPAGPDSATPASPSRGVSTAPTASDSKPLARSTPAQAETRSEPASTPAVGVPSGDDSAAPLFRAAAAQPTSASDADERAHFPWAVVVAVGALVVGGLVLMVINYTQGPGAGSQTASADGPPANAAAATTAAASGIDPRVAALIGDWSGNGADCSASPLKITVSDNQKISLTVSNATTSGTVEEVAADGSIHSSWQDGDWVYTLAGDSLIMDPPKGQPMVYTRCAG